MHESNGESARVMDCSLSSVSRLGFSTYASKFTCLSTTAYRLHVVEASPDG